MASIRATIRIPLEKARGFRSEESVGIEVVMQQRFGEEILDEENQGSDEENPFADERTMVLR